MGWDSNATSDVGYKDLYYCMICEEFFWRSPIAPGYCPNCWADDRYVLGPLPHKNVDLNKLKARRRKKYGDKMRR
jgi:hypothetical protein